MKSLHVDGKRIPYEIKNTTVIFHIPGGKKRYVQATQLLNMKNYEVCIEQDKHIFQITPNDVRKYVIDTGIDMLFT